MIIRNASLLLIALFVTLWVFAMNSENGDHNSALMYFVVLYPVVFGYVLVNSIILFILRKRLPGKKFRIILFLVSPLLSFLVFLVDRQNSSRLYLYFTFTLLAVNLFSYKLLKYNSATT
jgi:hypothetical protein